LLSDDTIFNRGVGICVMDIARVNRSKITKNERHIHAVSTIKVAYKTLL